MVTESINLQFKPVIFDPFVGPEIVRIDPSTEAQREMWTACLKESDDMQTYNALISLRFDGQFNKLAMEQAIQLLIQRHDTLRSAISPNGKYIYIFKNLSIDISYLDISEKSSNEKNSLIAVYLNDISLQMFNLLDEPLFEVKLIKVSNKEHHLILKSHYITYVSWSLRFILQDLSALYSTFAQNFSFDLSKNSSFIRSIEEHHRLFRIDENNQTKKLWIGELGKHLLSFNPKTDFAKFQFSIYANKRTDYLLTDELYNTIKEIGHRNDCSLSIILLTAFKIILHKSLGEVDIVVGLATSSQSTINHKQLVDSYINLLPIHSHFDEQTTFSDFLKVTGESVVNAYNQLQFTFNNLFKRNSELEGNIPVASSISFVFNTDNINNGVIFHNLTHKLTRYLTKCEKFEWYININDLDESSRIEWSYNSHLFKSETINEMMYDFENLLKKIAINPDVSISDFNKRIKHNHGAELSQSNNTNVQYHQYTPIHKLIAQTANRYPDKTAIQYNKYTVSYQYLDEATNQLAHYLIHEGIGVGNIVGIFMDRSPEMLITILAVLNAGAAYLPIDPEYPSERIKFMLVDSSANMLITSKKRDTPLKNRIKKILIEDALTMSKHYAKTETNISISGDSLAYVLYTSGSTGQPKGVLIEHHNLVNFLYSMLNKPGISRDDILLAVSTISFDIAGLELFLPLIAGAMILMADTTTVRDGRALLDLLINEKVSIMQATPSTWQMLLNAGWDEALPLKILCGGEVLSKGLAETLLSKGRELWNMYGPTETTIWSTIKQITDTENITIGQPIQNTNVYILDEYLKPVAEGVIGEIYIAGDGVARGYLNRPELTLEKFVKNPFNKIGNTFMYRTGDLGMFRENSEIQFLGRSDQQVKVRGHRIELSEIEYALNTIEDIQEAVVIVRGYNPADQQLVAYVVPQSTKLLAIESKVINLEEQIRKWKQQIQIKLPAYMIPNNIIVLPKLPLTPNAKIDKNALPEPVIIRAGMQETHLAPRTDIEKMVADIWIKCLGLEKVSVFDNFFELGGHSLVAVKVMTQLEKKTGKRLPLSTLFEYSTIEKLSLALQMDGWSVTWETLVPIKPQGTKMPLYIIHGSGLHVMLFNALARYIDIDQPIYGLQAKGINSNDKPHNTIEEMATYYINSIMETNPEGPYYLAGYSLGGLVAFEVSKQLLAIGKEIKLLAMFDTYAEQPYYQYSWLNRIWISSLNLLKENLYILTMIKNNPQETFYTKRRSLKTKINYLFKRIIYNQDVLKEINDDNYYEVRKANLLAASKYRLVPLPICINVFRAKKRSFYMDDFEFLGWRSFALKGVKIHEVPGDHFNIFSAPNDKEFAQVLQKVLDNC